MIISASVNPAIYSRLQVEPIAVGEMNRAASARPFPGGKAVAVAPNWPAVKRGGAR